MKEIQEASKQGREVPPSYINTTDAFVQVLGSVAVPDENGVPQRKHMNVLTLKHSWRESDFVLVPRYYVADIVGCGAEARAVGEEQAGRGLYRAFVQDHAGGKGRTKHFGPSPGSGQGAKGGKLEGWVRVRVAGKTDWRLVWMVVVAGSSQQQQPATPTDELGRTQSNVSATSPPAVNAGTLAKGKKARFCAVWWCCWTRPWQECEYQ
ncbi:hypothetical protein BDP27DRAFT_650678 [Rhodocollybia butyracea]|uniref:Uncharacterized protein n=1 Tax=Rhodocollybia butyracea TaxID=206335 RepID=A0A9P5P7H2_9AGAR|nr:hypothetical protein BDP27DRAFT_650678 [Rhodocollybia butyracea]